MFTFPNEYIVYLNAVLVVFLIFMIFRGYKKGMLLQVVGLVSTFVSLVIAWIFADVFVGVYRFVSYDGTSITKVDTFLSGEANKLIWFLILFILIRILMMVLTPIAALISKLPLIKQVNSVLGGLFSVVSFFIYTILIVYFLTLPIVKNGQTIIDNTFLEPIQSTVVPVLSFVDDVVEDNLALQSLIDNRGLSLEQKQSLIDLLSDNGFSQAEIREFLEHNE